MQKIFKLLGLLLSGIVVIMSKAFVLQKIYYWFIYGKICDLPLSYSNFIGVIIISALFFTRNKRSVKEEYTEKEYEVSVRGMILPWAVLMFAFLIKTIIL